MSSPSSAPPATRPARRATSPRWRCGRVTSPGACCCSGWAMSPSRTCARPEPPWAAGRRPSGECWPPPPSASRPSRFGPSPRGCCSAHTGSRSPRARRGRAAPVKCGSWSPPVTRSPPRLYRQPGRPPMRPRSPVTCQTCPPAGRLPPGWPVRRPGWRRPAGWPCGCASPANSPRRGSAASSRWARAPPSRPASSSWVTTREGRAPMWCSSARASRSTAAGSRSSRPMA